MISSAGVSAGGVVASEDGVVESGGVEGVDGVEGSEGAGEPADTIVPVMGTINRAGV